MEIEIIETPQANDFAAIIGTLNNVFGVYPGEVEITVQDLLERIAHTTNPLIFKAQITENLAGVAVCYGGRLAGFYHIRELAVLEEFRGQGVASALYKRIEDLARERGYDGVTLNTFNAFKDNLRLAIARGYEIYGLDTYGAYQNNPKIKLRLRFK